LVIAETPWKVEGVVRLALGIMATACVGLVFAILLGSKRIQLTADHREFAQMAVWEVFFEGGALVWIWFFLRENLVSPGKAFGLEAARQPNAARWGVLAAVAAVPAVLGLQYLCGRLMSHPEAQQMIQMLERADLPTGERLFIGALAVLVAPVAEEAMFRGILYPTIKQAGHPRAAVWVTSLLFAGMHFNAESFAPLTVFSMLLIWLYEKTGSLLAPITAHSLFNYTNFVMLMLASAPGSPITVK
jgi:membrane protease YdiL (CAAX protease family)